ncbi:MAG TPA: prenyltransferase/squalene oxidase repeat-containing protein [Solirubrobacterales bacterium]
MAVLFLVWVSAASAASQAEIDAAAAKAAAYLRAKVTASGEPTDPEGFIEFDHSQFSSDWAALGLAAAGVNAADVPGGGPSLQGFLAAEYGGNTGWWTSPPPFLLANEWARVALVAHAAGLDTSRVSAELNLPARIAGTWNAATGSFGDFEGASSPRNTAIGILGLLASPTPRWALAPAIAHLRAQQEGDGGWSEEAMTRAEMTGTALAALCEAGAPAYDPAVAAGVAYLHGEEDATTGAIEEPFAEVTAEAVMGLNACGVDPRAGAWTTATGETPIDFLLSAQTASGAGEGGFSFEPGETPNVYATTLALAAIRGEGFVVEPPAREAAGLPSVRPAPAVAAGTPVAHLLAIEGAPGNVRMCSVEAPSGASLREVLGDAEAETFPVYPAGCVHSFTFEGGVLASLDGVAPESVDQSWLLRLGRGAEAVAVDGPIPFGDVIALRVGPTPAATGGETVVGPAGPAGSSGAAGATGATGSTGATGATGAVGPQGPRGRRGATSRPGGGGRAKCRAIAAHKARTGRHVTARCGARGRWRSEGALGSGG